MTKGFVKIYPTIFLTVLLLGGSAAGQQKFEPNVNSRREAVAKGHVKEFQAAMEAIASEAEGQAEWAHRTGAALHQGQGASDHSPRTLWLGGGNEICFVCF